MTYNCLDEHYDSTNCYFAKTNLLYYTWPIRTRLA